MMRSSGQYYLLLQQGGRSEGRRHSWINKMPENCHRECVVLASIRQTCLPVSQSAEESINIYSADGVSLGLRGTPICFDGGWMADNSFKALK